MSITDALLPLMPSTVVWEQPTGTSDYPGGATTSYVARGTFRCRRHTETVDSPGPEGITTYQREICWIAGTPDMQSEDRLRFEDGSVVAIDGIDRLYDEDGLSHLRVVLGGTWVGRR